MPEWATGYFSIALICLGGLLALLLDRQEPQNDKAPKRKHWPWGKIGGAIAIIGGVLSAIGQSEIDAENKALQRQIVNYHTGGESKLFVDFGKVVEKKAQGTITLIGEDSMPNATIDARVITDKPCGKAPFERLPVIAKHTGLKYILPIPENGNSVAIMYITQPLLTTIEFIGIQTNAGETSFAYRAFRKIGNAGGVGRLVEFENPIRKVDPGFALDKGGKIPFVDYPDKWKVLGYELVGTDLEP